MAGSIQVEFEHDYQKKLMIQSFKGGACLASAAEVQEWRQQWMAALSSWHSPYKLLVDCSHLSVADGDEVRDSLALMYKFFQGFFLRKAAGFAPHADELKALPFPVFETEGEASAELGVRVGTRAKPGDFRSNIQIQNHFRTHCVEVGFGEPVVLNTPEQMSILRSKLTNNLMQWHSKWSLLFDCSNLEVDPAVHEDFGAMLRALRGFFMKEVIGYAPKGAKESYPFPVYRARHRAAALLEGEGNFSGDEADCNSRKTPAST